jgi:hypothetical protein
MQVSVTDPSVGIFDEIEAGIWDDGLEAIIEAAVARRKFVRDMKGANNQIEFKHGEHVRIVDIRPKYLNGITGTINKGRMPSRRGDLMVDIDAHCYPRISHRFSRTVGVPASSLERV